MKADLHTHTVNSGHGFGTIWENARKAKEQGIELLGLTDHGPAMDGGPVDTYFKVGPRLESVIEGVRVLFGVEGNIVDTDANLDLEDRILDKLDLVSVGFHKYSGYEDQGIETNTEVLKQVIRKPQVNMITHPYAPTVKVDIEEITKEAIKNNVLLEINSSYFFTGKTEVQETWNKIKTMIKILQEHEHRLIINSDAHTPFEIGKFQPVLDKMEELGLRDKDILNYYPKDILNFLHIT